MTMTVPHSAFNSNAFVNFSPRRDVADRLRARKNFCTMATLDDLSMSHATQEFPLLALLISLSAAKVYDEDDNSYKRLQPKSVVEVRRAE